jgi:hypothetical protein
MAEGSPVAFVLSSPCQWGVGGAGHTRGLDTISLPPCVGPVAAGTINEIDRERVSFIVRRIVRPPDRPDDPLP